MADNIVSNMFGVDPDQLAQQRNQSLQAKAYQYAQLDPMQQAHMNLYQGGGMLAGAGAKMMGMTTPEERIAGVRQQSMQGINPDDPDSLFEAARKLNEAGDAQGAMLMAQNARQLQAEMSKQKYESAKTAQTEAMTTDIPKQKHEEAMAKIQQAADIAKQRSEDNRLAIQERAAASKRHDELMKYLAEVKSGEKTTTSETGQNTVSNLTTQLRDYYRQLDDAGAITNPDKSIMENIGSWVSSSSVGQVGGSIVGSQAQTVRDSIKQQRPLLLQAIKQATGMSAKQMDSNTELQMYLSAATDPKLSVKANRDALDMLEKLYGIDGVGIPNSKKTTTEKKTSIPAGVAEEWIRVNGKLQRK
jgi:hypothetical protein